MPSWLPPVVEQVWSFLAVALAVHALGQVSKHIAAKLGWRRYRGSDVRKLLETYRDAPREVDSGDIVLPSDASWYDITLRIHPILSGALLGFLPLPTLNVIDELGAAEGTASLVAARCAWFALAGALSGQLHGAVKFAFTEGRERIFGLLGGATKRSSSPPPDVSSGNEDR